jgi:uncharacterized protein
MAGKVVHVELPAQDTGRAKEFWGSLFGFQFQQYEGPVEYHMFQQEGQGGAIYPQQADEIGPIVYFDVEDMDAALTRVRELGGTVREGKNPVPSMGWYAHCSDTEGNRFSLWQNDESAPAPAGT